MPRKTQYTVDDVVDAAYELAEKNGWEGLSVSAVAKALGSSTMPVYSHFDNLEKLKDEVVKRGWKKVKEYEDRTYTGDVWVDQSIGYVFFANAEKKIFLCMFDGRNLELQREMLRRHWFHLADQLKDYEGFKGLVESQILVIRNSRGIMSHGMALSVSTGWNKLAHEDSVIIQYMKTASRALLSGYRDLYIRGDEDMQELDGYVDEYIKKYKAQKP